MKFHTEILSKEQKSLFSFIKQFSPHFYLVGGTAIALQLGHRKSIDFDLFLPNKEILPLRKITSNIKNNGGKYQVLINENFHYEIVLHNVKITRFAYMFPIPQDKVVSLDSLQIPDLLHLSAMKVHAISKRAKWKDYVDMYFLIKKFGIKTICDYAKDFFQGEINIKLFLSQLAYFDDIDYSESIEFMKGYYVSNSDIKAFLQAKAIEQ